MYWKEIHITGFTKVTCRKYKLLDLQNSHTKQSKYKILKTYFMKRKRMIKKRLEINPLNPELNPICYLLALLGAHHFLHVSRIRVKLLTLRRLMSYIYMEHPFLMFLDHTQ